MRLFYLICAILVIALGLAHTAATFVFFDTLTSRAIWFASAGLVLVLQGALNILNRAYGATARGVRWTCVGANLVMAAFTTLAGIVDRAPAAQLLVIVGLQLATLSLSWLPAARGRPVQP